MATSSPRPPSARRTIRLVGPVRVEIDGRPLAVDTRKAIALLAYLAVTDRPAARETLAALLWPESDGPAGRGALRRTLSVLVAALGGEGLAVDRASIALEPGWEVDLRDVRSALASVRAHRHEPDEACPTCLAALESATALDRGEFMAGFGLRDSEAFDEWQLAEAESYRRELAGLLERLARARTAAGDTAGAIAAGQRWVELDPLHEPAHRLLMLAYARAGEQAAAVGQYRACVRVLDAELGVPPLAETTELYEAIRAGRLPAEPARGPASLPGVAESPPTAPEPVTPEPMPLVGRETSLAALLGAYEALGPDGRLVVVEGEPGIGKTRLVETFERAVADRGGVVLAARAFAGESSIAFGPIAALVAVALDRPGVADRAGQLRPDQLEAAAPIVPRLRSLLADRPPTERPLDALGRARAVEALAGLLTVFVAGQAPGMLVVDDADRADDSSLEVLAFLARRLANRPVGLVVTSRPLVDTNGALRRMVAAAERDGHAVRVVLERLARDDVERLAAAALGSPPDASYVDRLFAESEGLPLYVAEVLAAGPDAPTVMPSNVRALLRARIAAVGDLAAQLLAAASVVGRSFDLDTVRAASGRSEDETVDGFDELVRRGLVREVGTIDGDVRLDFTHGALRDVAYESLGLARRRLLHRRAADALRTAPGTPDLTRWSRVAHHETEAGRPGEAVAAHLAAARLAGAVFANLEAREHLEAALGLEAEPSSEVHADLGLVLTLLGDYVGAIGQFEAAAASASPDVAWTVERGLALVHARLGDWARAASHLEDAIATSPDDPATRAGLLADRSAVRGRLGDSVGAEGDGREALRIAERAGDAGLVARACQVLAVLARNRGDLATAATLLRRALAATDDGDGSDVGGADPGLRIAALNSLALVRAADGDRPAGIALLGEAIGLCERQGDRHRRAALENNLADLLRAEGRREEAMDHLKRAVAIFADIGGRPGVPEPEIWKLVEW